MWRRVLRLPWKASFVENPDQNKSYEFKVNTDFKELMPKDENDIAAAFNFALQGAIKFYANGTIIIPNEMKLAVEDFKKQDNHIFAFLDDVCEPFKCGQVPDDSPYISVKDLYERYKLWEGVPKNKKHNSDSSFSKAMTSALQRPSVPMGGSRRKVYKGLIFNNQ